MFRYFYIMKRYLTILFFLLPLAAIAQNAKSEPLFNQAVEKSVVGQYEEAIPYLKAFKGKDHMIAPSVLGALGNCYSQQGDHAKAAATLMKAAAKADNNVLSAGYLIQAGQLYESLGKNAEALAAYKLVKSNTYADRKVGKK